VLYGTYCGRFYQGLGTSQPRRTSHNLSREHMCSNFENFPDPVLSLSQNTRTPRACFIRLISIYRARCGSTSRLLVMKMSELHVPEAWESHGNSHVCHGCEKIAHNFRAKREERRRRGSLLRRRDDAYVNRHLAMTYDTCAEGGRSSWEINIRFPFRADESLERTDGRTDGQGESII